MSETANTREVDIDIAKGIGICMVVFGHLSGYGLGCFGLTGFFYVFHMPLFFILSGFFYKKEASLLETLASKFKHLYLPFLIANIAYLLFSFFFKKNVSLLSDTLMILFGIRVMPKVGTTWFLLALFWASILFKVISDVCKNRLSLAFLICVFLFILGISMPSVFFVKQIFTGLFFFFVGILFRKYGIKTFLTNTEWWLKLLISIVCAIFVYFISVVNPIDMYFNKYGNPFLFVVGALTGTILCLIVSQILSSVSVLNKLLSFLGRNTLFIIILHILIIQGVFVVRGKMQDWSISFADSPIWIWYLLCIVLALSIPSLLQYVFKKKCS